MFFKKKNFNKSLKYLSRYKSPSLCVEIKKFKELLMPILVCILHTYCNKYFTFILTTQINRNENERYYTQRSQIFGIPYFLKIKKHFLAFSSLSSLIPFAFLSN